MSELKELFEKLKREMLMPTISSSQHSELLETMQSEIERLTLAVQSLTDLTNTHEGVEAGQLAHIERLERQLEAAERALNEIGVLVPDSIYYPGNRVNRVLRHYFAQSHGKDLKSDR